MTPPTDEERLRIVMREMLRSGQAGARPPVTPAELRNQASRRTLRRIDTKVVVAVAAVAAVIVTLIAVGPLRSSSGPPHPVTNQPTTTTTTTTPSTTTTPAPTIPAAAASQLDAFVAAESATNSAAATQSGQQPHFITDHSPPEVDGASIVAVAAFSYEPGGLPVQVLGYSGGRWSPVAALPSPTGQAGSNTSASVVYLT